MKKNILVIGMGAWAFGKERRAASAFSHMDRLRPFFLVTKWEDGSVTRLLRKHNFEFVHMPLGYVGRSRPLWTLIALFHLPELWFGVIQAYLRRKCEALLFLETRSLLSTLPAVLFLKYFRHAKIFFYLGDRFKDYWPNRLTAILMNWMGEKVIVNSLAVQKSLIAVGARESSIHVIYNGINWLMFDEVDPDGFRERHGCPKDKFLIGYVGQLVPNKGVWDFVEAARRVLQRNEQCRFVMIGKGNPTNDCQPELESFLKAQGLEDKIVLTGWIDPMEQAYRALDLLVVPSRHEDPAPNVCIEAMAAGVPVIATRSGGIPEIVMDGKTGFLVEKQDPEQLADRILSLTKDVTLRKRMGKEARSVVKQKFDIHKNACQIETLISEETQGSLS